MILKEFKVKEDLLKVKGNVNCITSE